MKSLLTLFSLFLVSTALLAQDLAALKYRELGPFRGGRVTTVAGIASEPGTFYLGATGGGVWKTEDYGTSWDNVSDGYFSTPSIGAIAVAQNDPNIVYVGTGTDGIRSNVIEGKGVYKSIDGGKTWNHIGLEWVGQIGAVRIHPSNFNVVYVAAIGQAFQSNPERGIYKTVDGGKSWQKVLYLSDEVGFSDVELMPTNPEILFATAWKARRYPWSIVSGGTADEGGMYRSDDGGANWRKITKGLPQELIGKIDVELTPADSRKVFALVEAPDDEGGLYVSNDQGESFKLVSNDRGIRTRPFYYTNVRVDPTDADIIYVLATGYSKSTDGGKTWSRMRPPHGDNHDQWINPNNPDLFIQANDGGANVTHNGGKTWSTQFNQPTAELYQVEVDDQHPYWLYAGQQDNYTTVSVPSLAPYGMQAGGIGYIMNTGGCETGPAVPKPGNPDIVYANCKGRFTVFNKKTGTEKNYYVGGHYMYGHNPKDLKYRFQRVSPIHVSPHNPDVVYHCSQYVHKTTDDGVTWETISPDLTAFEDDKQVISGAPITRDITGEEFYSTIYAIRESPVQEGVIWVGANDGPVHVTQDGGQNWSKVTPPKLPGGGRVDAVEPSPHNAAKAYVSVLRYQLGDRKPYIYKTENFGKSWTLLTDGTNGIPADYPTRVVREDPEREGLLFAGTEYGVFVSFNDGATWQPLQNNLPVTPITDLKITRGDLVMSTMGRGFWTLDNITTLRQEAITNTDAITLFKPRDTYRYPYPSPARGIRQPSYPRPSVIIDYYLPQKLSTPAKMEILDESGQVINTFVSDTTKKASESVITDMSTNQVQYLVSTSLKTGKGLQRFSWDMTHQGAWHKSQGRRYAGGPRVSPGSYTVRLTAGGETYEQTFELLTDPRSDVTPQEVVANEKVVLAVRDLLTAARKMESDLEAEKEKLEKKENLSDADTNRLQALSTQLAALQTKDGTYEQPMITDQIGYLYGMVNGPDQVPSKEAKVRLEELKEQLDKLQDNVD